MGKIKKFSLLFMSSSILGSCSYQLDEVAPPNDLISRDSFQLVLLDMMLLEGYVKTQHNNVHDFYQIIMKSADPIFEKYNIDSSRYAGSMDYYSHHQNILKEMYEVVQDSITLWSVSDLVLPGDSVVLTK
mgnify:CR=1 FL=1